MWANERYRIGHRSPELWGLPCIPETAGALHESALFCVPTLPAHRIFDARARKRLLRQRNIQTQQAHELQCVP